MNIASKAFLIGRLRHLKVSPTFLIGHHTRVKTHVTVMQFVIKYRAQESK